MANRNRQWIAAIATALAMGLVAAGAAAQESASSSRPSVHQVATSQAASAAASADEERPVLSSGRGAETRPVSRDATTSLSEWARTIGALVFVVAIIFGLRALLRRFGPGPAHRKGGRGEAIEVLARSSVLPRQHLLLVRLGRRVLLLGSTAAGLSTLAEIQDGEEIAELMEVIEGGSVEAIRSLAKPMDDASKPREGHAQ